jgi:hypothetical protein
VIEFRKNKDEKKRYDVVIAGYETSFSIVFMKHDIDDNVINEWWLFNNIEFGDRELISPHKTLNNAKLGLLRKVLTMEVLIYELHELYKKDI